LTGFQYVFTIIIIGPSCIVNYSIVNPLARRSAQIAAEISSKAQLVYIVFPAFICFYFLPLDMSPTSSVGLFLGHCLQSHTTSVGLSVSFFIYGYCMLVSMPTWCIARSIIRSVHHRI